MSPEPTKQPQYWLVSLFCVLYGLLRTRHDFGENAIINLLLQAESACRP